MLHAERIINALVDDIVQEQHLCRLIDERQQRENPRADQHLNRSADERVCFLHSRTDHGIGQEA